LLSGDFKDRDTLNLNKGDCSKILSSAQCYLKKFFRKEEIKSQIGVERVFLGNREYAGPKNNILCLFLVAFVA